MWQDIPPADFSFFNSHNLYIAQQLKCCATLFNLDYTINFRFEQGKFVIPIVSLILPYFLILPKFRTVLPAVSANLRAILKAP